MITFGTDKRIYIVPERKVIARKNLQVTYRTARFTKNAIFEDSIKKTHKVP